jgi:single-stranded-DNA-specific exonuclease
MKWITPPPEAVPPELLEAVDGNELLAQLLVRRGIVTPDQARAFLDPDHFTPTSSDELPGMQAGVEILATAIQAGARIGVWGDFDVDGQTSTTQLVSALEQLGADVVYHIPVRATESHGLNIEYLDRLLDQGIQVLLTCDTGITDHREIEYVRARGVKVVVTDHHDLAPELPEADAIINAKMLPEGHPLSSLPGVGVAYKLVESLYARFGQQGKEEQFLDLAALGIVADVALLHGDTRYLLQRGLEALRKPERLGLKIMYELAEIEPAFLSEEDIGFSIAPRLNSLGRLGDANQIVDFLTTDREGRARVIANQLEGLNAQRKLLTSQVFQAALDQLERSPELQSSPVLVLVGERWPAGVVGIVANRLVERFGKPAVLLTRADGGQARGSARSIEGCDISQAIAACEPLLDSFGGHPMAAGLALPVENIDHFRKRLAEAVEQQLGDEPLGPTLEIDLTLDLDQFSFSLVEQIERLAPFGPGNPPVILSAPSLKLVSHSQLGKTGEHLRLIVEDQEGVQQSVLWWGGAGQDLPQGIFDLAYSARISTFKGERQLQIELRDFQTVVEPEPEVAAAAIEVVDCRELADPSARLEEILQTEEDIVIWAEAEGGAAVSGLQRDELITGRTLVIWTLPPSGAVIQEAIQKVEPERIFFLGIDPRMDDVSEFLNRLAGLCRYAISRQNGEINLNRLAGAMAQTQAAVRVGVGWLEAKGHISVEAETIESLQISKGQPSNPVMASPALIIESLGFLLKESASFRRFMMGVSESRLDTILKP